MSGFRTCPHCQRLTLNQRCDNPECTGPGARTTMPPPPLAVVDETWTEPPVESLPMEMRPLYYDPVPVDLDAEAEVWEKFRREGGPVHDADGKVIGHCGPSTQNPDDPGEWIIPFKGVES